MIRATRNPFPLNRKFKTGPQLRTSALRVFAVRPISRARSIQKTKSDTPPF